MCAATPQRHETRCPSLDNCPAEILSEIANNLEIGDIIRLRATSKYLNEFSYTHAVWIAAAQRIAYYHPLNLPLGRSIADCSVGELFLATFRATKLRQILRGQDYDTVIVLKDPICIMPPPSSNEARIRLLPGGRYFSIITSPRYALWDSHVQRIVGEIVKEGYHFIGHRKVILSETKGVTRFIVACCLRPDGGSGTVATVFSVFEILYPSLDPQRPASVGELICRAVQLTQHTIYLDDGIAAVAGPRFRHPGTDMRAVISVIDLATLKMAVVYTEIMMVWNSSVYIYHSGNDLRVYHDRYNSRSLSSYNLRDLLVNDGIDGCTVEPTTYQTVAFEEDTHEGARWVHTVPETQQGAFDCIPVSTGYRILWDAEFITFLRIPLNDILEYSKVPWSQQRTEHMDYCRRDIPHKPIILDRGYIALFSEEDRKVMLKLIVFPLRPTDGITFPAERTLVVPNDIDVEDITDVCFDDMSGILALRLVESPDIHLFHLV